MTDESAKFVLAMYRVASLNERVLRGMRRRLSGVEFTDSERQILLAIFAQPDRPDSELAAELGMARGQLSRTLKKLIETRLVEFTAHPRHRGQRLLSLSGTGLEAASTLSDQTAEAFDEEFAGLNPDEQQFLSSSMLKSRSTLDRSAIKVFDVRPIGKDDWGWLLHTASLQAGSELNWSTEYTSYLAQLIAANIRQPYLDGHGGWIAVRNGRRVGACLLTVGTDPIRAQGDELTGWMPLIFVEREHRCLGIGGRLVSKCVEAARELTLISIDVSIAKSQKPLMKLLTAHRFKGRHLIREQIRFGKLDIWRDYSLKLGTLTGKR